MLDYTTHYASLQVVQEEAAAKAASGSRALVAAVQTTRSEPAHAVLGCLVSKLFEHSGATDTEVKLLDRASRAWADIRAFLDEVAALRNSLESIVLNPKQPGAAQAASDIVQKIKTSLPTRSKNLGSELDSLGDELKKLTFIVPAARQADKPVSEWLWRDIVRSRRSGALRCAIVERARADGSADLLSFAYGVLADYAANLCGHPYLNEAVGGPPRSHPYRSRVGANAIGTKVRVDLPNNTIDAAGLQRLLRFTSSSSELPPRVATLLEGALSGVYGPGLPAHPDLHGSFATLVRHLQLLSSFSALPLPQPIDSQLVQAMLSAAPGVSPQGGGSGTGGGYPPPSGGNTGGSGSGGDHLVGGLLSPLQLVSAWPPYVFFSQRHALSTQQLPLHFGVAT